jgi:hypothetical protein
MQLFTFEKHFDDKVKSYNYMLKPLTDCTADEIKDVIVFRHFPNLQEAVKWLL